MEVATHELDPFGRIDGLRTKGAGFYSHLDRNPLCNMLEAVLRILRCDKYVGLCVKVKVGSLKNDSAKGDRLWPIPHIFGTKMRKGSTHRLKPILHLYNTVR